MNPISVFTKALKEPVDRWAPRLRDLGLDGVELPVRPGYQVEPERVLEDLPRVAEQLAEYGLAIHSVAGPEEPDTIAACGAVGVPILRTMAPVPPEMTYLEAEWQIIKRYRSLVPYLEEHGVCLGVQNHWNRFVSGAVATRRLVESFDPRHVGIVLDPAHCSLGGEIPDLAFDVSASHLVRVNLKNFRWTEATSPEAPYSMWAVSCVAGRRGLTEWPRVIEQVKQHNFTGQVCICAEWDDTDRFWSLLAEDVAFARELLD
ncbi:MAG: sugar phosphate isomerase/epimerase family protein [Planctomycetota bacterium]